MARSPDGTVAPDLRLLLIGMMGSGKTTVGLVLARRLGWPYIDNDELLLRTTGRTARELLASGGEAALRAGEAAVVEQALALEPPVVLGIAGGVVLDPLARSRLPAVGHVIWLRARADTLLPRLGPGDHRPFMEGDLQGWVERMVIERAPLYLEVAETVVDVDGRTPDEIVDAILADVRQPDSSGGSGAGRIDQT